MEKLGSDSRTDVQLAKVGSSGGSNLHQGAAITYYLLLITLFSCCMFMASAIAVSGSPLTLRVQHCPIWPSIAR